MTIDSQLQSFFPQLTDSPKLMAELKEKVQLVDLEKNTVILKEGQYVQYIPLLIKGLIKVYREVEQGNELLLYYIQPGETCIMSVLTNVKNEASTVKAVVEENTKVLLVPADVARDLTAKYREWNSYLYLLFSSKYEALLYTIELLTFSRKDRLLREYLFNEAKLKGSNTIHKTHQEIALELGASREGISRLLKKMEQDNLLILGQGMIKILQ
ncbi:MAG: Crp/Fnr family transcriptional regulator [Flavobacteriaceae bacterium]|nr:Crp/Fnr family transcriptional regulator [Flavobacteriaceae bacterium]